MSTIRDGGCLLDPSEPIPLFLAPNPARVALEKLGIVTFDELTRHRGIELFSTRGIGLKGWTWLRRLLNQHRITMACGWPVDAPTVFGPPAVIESILERSRQGVYFIRGAEFIKIGLSGCVTERLASLRWSSPVTLEPLGFIHVFERSGLITKERELHARFAADRSHGEWFRETPALRLFIEQHAYPSWPA